MNTISRRPTTGRPLLGVVAFACLSLLCGYGAEVFKNQDCLDCHNDPSNVRKVKGKEIPLELFTTNRFEKSVHATLA